MNAAYRFELGVIQAEQGDCGAAWRTFRASVALQDTETVRRARDAAMADLCPTLAPWEGNLGVRLILDPNYNNAPDTDTITIQGLPFVLSPEAQPQQRTGLQVQGGLAYNYLLQPGQYIVADALGSVTLLTDTEDNAATLDLGLSWRTQSGTLDWRIGPRLGFQWEQDAELVTRPGVGGELSWMANPRTSLTTTATLRWPDGDPGNSGQDAGLSLSILHLLDNGNRLQVDLLAGAYDRDLDWESYQAFSLTVSLAGQLSPAYGYDLFASLGQRSHQTPHPLFLETRRDHTYTIGGAVSFAALETPLGRPYLGLQYTATSSTIDFYTYNKPMLLAGFSRQF
jgi:hypothetical protein